NNAYTWVNTYGSGLQGGPYVPTSRAVSAGTGLTGGGALSTNITISAVFGNTAGTIAQGNDSRIVNGQTAYSWGNHASAGYVPQSRTLQFIAGTGLSVSGTDSTNLSVDRNVTYSVNFGTSAGTVAQRNDSRINNGQTAYGWGNHASAGYFTSGGTIPSVGTFPMFSGTNTIGNSFLTQSGGALYYAGNVNVSNDLTVGSLAYFNGNVNLYKSATV